MFSGERKGAIGTNGLARGKGRMVCKSQGDNKTKNF